MKLPIKKTMFFLCIITISVFCIACSKYIDKHYKNIPLNKNSTKTSISELAYDNNNDKTLVYIKEDSGYEPYIVLSKDYYGKTLLMREYLLDTPRQFNIYERNGAGNSYYVNSLIDKFLSNDFFNTLSPKMQEIILEMDIDITTKESVAPGPILETEKIKRKIFLLSSYEVNGPVSSMHAKEGIQQKYFGNYDDHKKRIATYKNGKIMNYWLRTPYTWFDFTVCAVVYDGTIDSATSVDYVLGVRPIFCVEGNIPVFKKQVEGIGQVYVIE